MALSRRRDEWERTADLLAMMHNVNASKSSERTTAEKVNRFPKPKPPPIKMPITVLKCLTE